MNSSKEVLDLYTRCNKNKYITKNSEEERDMSLAEYTVLSCINALAIYSEVMKDVDIKKVIKMLLVDSISEEDLSKLCKRDELLELKKENNNLNTIESYVARTACGLTRMNSKTVNSAFPAMKELSDSYKKLQTTIRQGHIYWGVRLDRKESILEHIYGTMILALGLSSEYDYSVDFDKVIEMLLLHETEEILIGDLTAWDVSQEEKIEKGKKAVNEVLKNLNKKEEFINLIEEFNGRKTIESEYAYLFDKLEYDLQVKMYELMGAYDFQNIPSNIVTESNEVKNIINQGAKNVFDVHYEYDKNKYSNFPAIRRILEYSKK